MNRLKTAVVGCGKVGHFHAKAFAQLPQSEFVGACNHNIGRAEEYAAEYGVRAYDSVERMIDDTGAQLVAICTPHPNHKQGALAAISRGAHVLIEKPLAIAVEDCDAILDAAAKAGVTVAVTSQRRFYPCAQRIKRAIEDGKLGKPILGTVTMLGWRDMAYYASDPWRGSWEGEGGGVLVNQAAHQMDLLLWYMGEAESVYGAWDTLNHPGLEVDDTACAVVRFKSGALGNIVVTNSVNPALYGNVRVHGENGASVGVQTDGGAMFIAGMSGIAEPPYNDLWTVPGEADMLPVWRQGDADFFDSVDNLYYFHRVQAADAIDAILEGRSPQVTGEDGRRVVRLFQAIYESQRLGRPVQLT